MKKIVLICFTFLISLSFSAQVNDDYYEFYDYECEYHPNGQIAWVKEFRDGLATGIWMKLDDKGNLLSQLDTREKQDSLEKHHAYNFPYYAEDATFPGGPAGMQKWIAEHVQYPLNKSGKKSGKGTVFLSFVVEVDGTITGVHVEKGVSEDLDAEAVRLVYSMPNWKPGKEFGKVMRSRCRLPIKFSML